MAEHGQPFMSISRVHWHGLLASRVAFLLPRRSSPMWILWALPVVCSSWSESPPLHYPHFLSRRVFVLNGSWDFIFLGDVVMEAVELGSAQGWSQVLVPDAFDLRPDTPNCECFSDALVCQHCCDRSLGHRGEEKCWGDQRRLEGVWIFDENPEAPFGPCCGPDRLRNQRGVALYRTHVETRPGAAAVLMFGACAFRCMVAVDGAVLEDHAGLSPFEVRVPARDDEITVRELLVLVDNRFNYETHPVHQPKYDWYQAGGLLRPVQFHELRNSSFYMTSVQVHPRSLTTVDLQVAVSDLARHHPGLQYHYDFAEDGDCTEAHRWPSFGAESLKDVEVPGARPWSPNSPHLHHLTVAMTVPNGAILDCIRVRFGLRLVETRGSQILLNGAPLKLLGFNRHDLLDSPVMTYDSLVRDVQLLLDLGANFVRGAHYAQDQRFLDLCDVHGLLVWEEVLGWQNTVADFANPTFVLQSLRMARELAVASVNHPSVIFLGFFNEGESFDDGEPTTALYHAMANELRRRSGRTRLIGYGSNHVGQDRQLAAVDVHAFHLYLAWYPTTQLADKEEVRGIPGVWEQVRQWSAEIADKPMLVTEAGAGGLYGFRGPVEQKWTEEYQALLVETHLEAVIHSPGIAGISLWQFADIPIDRSVSDEQHRPRGLNNKGVLSLSRQPKLAAGIAQQLLREALGAGETARKVLAKNLEIRKEEAQAADESSDESSDISSASSNSSASSEAELRGTGGHQGVGGPGRWSKEYQAAPVGRELALPTYCATWELPGMMEQSAKSLLKANPSRQRASTAGPRWAQSEEAKDGSGSPPQESQDRRDAVAFLFRTLDADGDERLNLPEMERFASLCGFTGEWATEYEAPGAPAPRLAVLLEGRAMTVIDIH
eukprot:Skav212583  [mRNA]  locus=scaffold125:449307:457734:- [translate_table: standard]